MDEKNKELNFDLHYDSDLDRTLYQEYWTEMREIKKDAKETRKS